MKCSDLTILNLTELYVEDLKDYSNFKTKLKLAENGSYLKMYLTNKITNKQLNVIKHCLRKQQLLCLKTPIEI